MNERIRELMVELKKTVSTHRGDEVLVGYDEIEKFAELIVRECATLVDAAFDIDEHSGEVVSYADGGQLKEHFGVEE